MKALILLATILSLNSWALTAEEEVIANKYPDVVVTKTVRAHHAGLGRSKTEIVFEKEKAIDYAKLILKLDAQK